MLNAADCATRTDIPGTVMQGRKVQISTRHDLESE